MSTASDRRARANRTALFGSLLMLTAAVGAPVATMNSASAAKSHDPVSAALPSAVMVLMVEVENGQLIPVNSGSGTIVDANGSVLTNHHVLYDESSGRLHDLFLIGVHRSNLDEPELVCAGRPSEAVLRSEVDLALIRCTLDRNGRPWHPESWPSIPTRSLEDRVGHGEPLWVLGYPNAGSRSVARTAGLVTGWTGEHGGADTQAFIRTDVAITKGNSGGTALDAHGRFVGVPTAFREVKTDQGGTMVSAGRVGLIRPLDLARDLLRIAHAGGPSVGMAPEDPQVDRPRDVVITSTVVDITTGKPVAGALVFALRPGLATEALSIRALDQQVLAWGRTDAGGVFRFGAALPSAASYGIAVVAPGYLPVRETGALHLPKDAPSEVDPWQRLNLIPTRE